MGTFHHLGRTSAYGGCGESADDDLGGCDAVGTDGGHGDVTVLASVVIVIVIAVIVCGSGNGGDRRWR